MKQPIFITGVQRSGSSLIAKIINTAGAWAGDCSTMMENKAIRQCVDDYYEKELQIPKEGQYPLPHRITIPSNWKEEIKSLLEKEGYKNEPWLYKSHRLTQIWELWNYAFPNAKWLIVRRRTGDVVNSCMKTGYMQAYTNEKVIKDIQVQNEKEGWLWWVNWHEQRFVQMIQEGLNCKVIWPERMVDGDYSQIYEAINWLGLEWKDDMISKIDPILWKGRKQKLLT